MQTGRFLAQRKENGEQMGAAGKSSAFFSLSFSDERDANGTWEIDADANAEIRTKKANETAGVKAGLSKYHHLELELGATGMAVKEIPSFSAPLQLQLAVSCGIRSLVNDIVPL